MAKDDDDRTNTPQDPNRYFDQNRYAEPDADGLLERSWFGARETRLGRLPNGDTGIIRKDGSTTTFYRPVGQGIFERYHLEQSYFGNRTTLTFKSNGRPDQEDFFNGLIHNTLVYNDDGSKDFVSKDNAGNILHRYSDDENGKRTTWELRDGTYHSKREQDGRTTSGREFGPWQATTERDAAGNETKTTWGIGNIFKRTVAFDDNGNKRVTTKLPFFKERVKSTSMSDAEVGVRELRKAAAREQAAGEPEMRQRGGGRDGDRGRESPGSRMSLSSIARPSSRAESSMTDAATVLGSMHTRPLDERLEEAAWATPNWADKESTPTESRRSSVVLKPDAKKLEFNPWVSSTGSTFDAASRRNSVALEPREGSPPLEGPARGPIRRLTSRGQSSQLGMNHGGEEALPEFSRAPLPHEVAALGDELDAELKREVGAWSAAAAAKHEPRVNQAGPGEGKAVIVEVPKATNAKVVTLGRRNPGVKNPRDMNRPNDRSVGI
jgi:hypothetical protein